MSVDGRDGLPHPTADAQPVAALDELPPGAQQPATGVSAIQGRMQGLLDAVLAVADGLELDTTLRRIVQAAVDLADAQFGALGVLAQDGSISRFIHVGIDEATRALMGTLPQGKGLLGQIVRGGRPVRVPDLGAHESSTGFPPHHPPMRTFLGVPVRVRDVVFGNLYLTEKNGGGEFTADDEAVVAALATAAGIAVHNADLFEEVRLRQLWLEATAEIRNELLAGASEEDALRLIARRAHELTRSDATVLALGSGEPEADLVVRAHCGAGEPGLSGVSLDVRAPLVREVVGGRVSVVTDDPGLLLAHAGVELPPYGSTVAAPVHSGGRAIGILVALRIRGADPFQPGDVPLLGSFAEQVTLALELRAKDRAARQLAVFADRDRIARDFHDQVIQRLFATGLQLQGVLRRTADPDVQMRVQQSVEQLDETVREIRTAIFDLHATSAEDATSLRRLLLDAAADASQGSAVVPSVRLAGAIDTLVPRPTGLHALAVVREAVSNAVRHAGAERVTVTIEVGDELLIDVVDDGVGIDPGVARSGLRNLAERAEECGGELIVRRAPLGGTRLSWRVPV